MIQLRRRLFLPLAAIALIAVSGSLVLPAGQEELTTEQQVLHVLNRLGFGPRPGDVEKVKSIGIKSYVEQQLHPEQVQDTLVEGKIADFKTLTMTPLQMTVAFPPPGIANRLKDNPQLKERIGEILGESMNETMPKEMDEKELNRRRRMVQFELSMARLMRAVYSERQLQEIMVDFWMNHFNVFMPKGLDRVLTTDYEENAVRPRALGTFEDLLTATAKHPAMLVYLDNWLSSTEAEEVRERMRSSRPGAERDRRFPGPRGQQDDMEMGVIAQRLGQPPALSRAKGLNENYARELLELHTLGVDGGYTQQDIIEVAKSFTGWTIAGPFQGSRFVFEPRMHVNGEKIVLGKTIQPAGIEEGEQIIRMLAHHPSTARFISTKLARRFVSDDPPAELVDAAARTFTKTGGDIREVLRTIFTSPQFFSAAAYQVKVKKPLELVASSLRAINADLRPNPSLLRTLGEMGEPLYMCQPPTGYPDTASAWINTNSLMKRLNFAAALAANRVPGVEVNVDSAQDLFKQLRLPVPDPAQIEQTRSILEKEDHQRMGRASAVGEVITAAFMLGSPQFQKR